MFKRFFTFGIILVLTYGFWISPNFKTVSAGVAIFLFGMIFLDQGFKAFSGLTLEKILKKSTDKVYKSIFFGFSAASLMQSSSLVSVLTISFLSAGLITLIEGIGIVLGANIGTTTGAWLIAGFGMKVDISAYAMPMLVFGVILNFHKYKTLKGIGSILAGLGFLFLGIYYMKEGFESFQNSISLMDYAMSGIKGVLVYVLVGIIATVVMQSSHATIILVITALATGQITYENSLSLVIGANIGTTITAILGSLTSNINGKRLALSDVMFKVTTGLIFIIFLIPISNFVEYLSELLGIAKNDPTLKLALFHTLFNITGVVLLVPFLKNYVNLIKKILPAKGGKGNDGIVRNIYLNKAGQEFPETAIISLLKETKHMYDNSIEVLLKVLGLNMKDIEGEVNYEELTKKVSIYEGDIDKLYGEKIKILFGEIMDFASQAQSKNEEKYFEDFSIIRRANLNIVEAIKTLKHIQRNLQRFLKSTNEQIKDEYEGIIEELIYIIKKIEILSNTTDNSEKIKILASMEKFVADNDVIDNGKIDELIRKNIITNEMATSLMKDTNYKNEICKKLILVSEIAYNREIFTETEEKRKYKIHKNILNSFGIPDKKVTKLVTKFKKKKTRLENKISKEKDKTKKNELRKKLEEINFILKKYEGQ